MAHLKPKNCCASLLYIGSSYFELDDFNGDGFKDILYTCGDNADYTGRHS